MKRNKAAAAWLLILLICLCGCQRAAQPPAADAAAEERLYALVVKDLSNPYMKYMCDGFQTACAELGAQALLTGPSGNADSADQIARVYALIERRVDAIAIAVNDLELLAPALHAAMEAGIPVVSVDSNADPADRRLHIQQASPEIIGRVLIQAAYEMLGGRGRVAILSTTRTMPNQALWLKWMRTELKQHPDKYADFKIVQTVYGSDEYAASAKVLNWLLDREPELDLVIAPTVVGIRAAADVIQSRGSGVLVTGLGLPSDMAPYIRSGVCPWMYLWNPIDMGYIAAYAADALARGESDGSVGQTLSAGSFGQKMIVQSADGGTEIVVGNPYQFDGSNIAIWEQLF